MPEDMEDLIDALMSPQGDAVMYRMIIEDLVQLGRDRREVQAEYQQFMKENATKWTSELSKLEQAVVYQQVNQFGIKEKTKLESGDFRLVYENGDSYEGGLMADGLRKQGRGRYLYSNGQSYEGDFKEDFIEGNGVYSFAGGERYEGEWVRGEKEGKGKLDLCQGQSYQGQFRADVYWGQGKQTFADGSIFQGCFEQGERRGFGVLRQSDGTIKAGLWTGEQCDVNY